MKVDRWFHCLGCQAIEQQISEFTAMSATEALAPEQSVDEVRESLTAIVKGQPTNTIGS